MLEQGYVRTRTRTVIDIRGRGFLSRWARRLLRPALTPVLGRWRVQ